MQSYLLTKKAFDTLSHRYLTNVYKFFNFGDNFIKWLHLIGTNRRACIILEDESFSTFFDLERGNAQGDTISPYIFNLGYQLLLFKLNYDLQIKALGSSVVIPPPLDPLPENVSIKPRKVYAYADDGNIITTMELESLEKIKSTLYDFGILSGLECNVEKTALMQVGTNAQIPREIIDLGFTITDNITVLGLTISGDSGNFDVNFEKICDRVTKKFNIWKRFNLSLPGRINIAKTMLYSQINYIGCFLKIPNNYISRLEDMIEKYVCGKLNISKKRLYLPPCDGGLGLFCLKDFLTAQKCSWIARSLDLDEIWKQKIYSKSLGAVWNVRKSFYDKRTEPVIHGIVSSFEKFMTNFVKSGDNYWNSYVLENNALLVNLRQKVRLKIESLNANTFLANKLVFWNLTVSDLFINKLRVKTLAQFNESLQVNIQREDHELLKKVANNARLKYKNNVPNAILGTTLATFILRKIKGSKRYRRYLIPPPINQIPHNIKKFSETTETIINMEDGKKLNRLWNTSFFSNSTRTFLFKFHNNTAGYNSAVAHFVRGHSNNCTFCDIQIIPEPNPETPIHLFFNCIIVEQILTNFFSNIFGHQTTVSRQELFVKFSRFTDQKNEIANIIAKLFIKYIWDCKVRKCLPFLENALISVRLELKTISNCSKKVREMLDQCDFNTEL